jgi:hypothetical protein
MDKNAGHLTLSANKIFIARYLRNCSAKFISRSSEGYAVLVRPWIENKGDRLTCYIMTSERVVSFINTLRVVVTIHTVFFNIK